MTMQSKDITSRMIYRGSLFDIETMNGGQYRAYYMLFCLSMASQLFGQV